MKIKIDRGAVDALAESPEMEQALRFGADVGADTSRRLAPEGETDDLKESIGSDSAPGRANVHVGVDYWEFPEYGTRYMAATPYMRPAIDAMKRVFS